jgi:hypothetical protein
MRYPNYCDNDNDYYYGFLFSIIENSAIWMLISSIVNEYYYKSTDFKDEKYLLQYGLAKIILEREGLDRIEITLGTILQY